MKKLYTIITACALALGANAQVRLPKAVYTLDFEGTETVADFGGIQHGSGTIVKSDDEHFGTYYQNMPDWSDYTLQVNFLEVPTSAFASILDKDTKTVSIGFWINPTIGNKNGFNNYWGPLFNCYNELGCAGHTWPQAFEVRYGGQIHGNAAGTWYDNNHDTGTGADGTPYSAEFMQSIMQWSVQTTKKDTQTDPETGEETEIDIPDYDDFAGNWHYFTMVYTGTDASPMNYKLYIDGELKIDCDEILSGDANLWAKISVLDRFCIGGNSFNWGDPDNAYAYDDVAFYADALTPEQIQIIMDLKRGNLTPEVQLIIARNQLEDILDDANDYAGVLSEQNLQTLSDVLGDIAAGTDPESFATAEAVYAEIARIQAIINADKTIVAALLKAQEKIAYLEDYAGITGYPGFDDFSLAIDEARSSLDDIQSTLAIDASMTALDAAKVTYIFSQTGDEINVSRVIDKPWFVAESFEPTMSEDGGYDFQSEAAANLTLGNWQMPIPEPLKGATDFQLFFTNGRTTANLFHSSTVAGVPLDVQQTITGLPKGYYELRADMCSTSLPTDNHIYAQSGDFTKVSPIATSLPTEFNVEGKTDHERSTCWIPLATTKIFVGEDGTMTIGAQSTTNGLAYEGWFCVTNFQLYYYGEDYNMEEDVIEQTEVVRALIDELKWAGDITVANQSLDEILGSSSDAYTKVSQLTDLENTINSWISQEESFVTDKNLQSLIESESDPVAKAIYTVGYNYIDAVVKSETMSIESIEALNALYAPYVQLAADAKSAASWGTDAASQAAAAAASDLAGFEDNIDFITAESAKLIGIMKSSIVEFEASLSAPKEITALVGNASFEQNQHTAWTIEGNADFQQAEIEFYNNSFNLYQTISDMPRGVYLLSASAFYRDGNDYRTVVDNYWTPADDGSTQTIYDTHAHMKLYARAGSHYTEVPVVSIASDSLTIGAEDDDSYLDYYGNHNHVSTDFASNDKTTDPVIYYPYWMWNAYDMISNRGLYGGNTVLFSIDEDTADLTIGVQKATTIEFDWAIIDNFRLFYCGQDIPDAIETVQNSASVSSSVPVAYYTVSGTPVQKPLTGIYIVKYADGTVAKQLFK